MKKYKILKTKNSEIIQTDLTFKQAEKLVTLFEKLDKQSAFLADKYEIVEIEKRKVEVRLKKNGNTIKVYKNEISALINLMDIYKFPYTEIFDTTWSTAGVQFEILVDFDY